jgi:hypothetical protein
MRWKCINCIRMQKIKKWLGADAIILQMGWVDVELTDL